MKHYRKEVYKMKRTENECVGCRALGLHCLGSSCPNRNVVRFYCDECKEEMDELYYFDGKELCIDCIAKKLEKVE